MKIPNTYGPNAPLPKVGSRWVWEIDQPGARCLLEVNEVFWNGEQWWVRTRDMFDGTPDSLRRDPLNEISRFWEAVTPVGLPAGRMTERRPQDAHAMAEPSVVTG